MDRRKMKRRQMVAGAVNRMLLALLTTVMVSGMLLHPLNDALWVLIIHKISALVFCLGIIIHILLHCKTGEKKHVS